MTIKLITYDLRSEDDHQRLYDRIKGYGRWSHYMEDTWLVNTDRTVSQIVSDLEPYLSRKDRLLVLTVGDDYQGLLPDKAWDWIRRNRD
jgi:hypothetical protein